MRFATPLMPGRLVRRYKRFFVDVALEDGTVVTAHCPNTGALRGCLTEGSAAWLEPSNNPKRKLAYTWKMVRIGDAMIHVDAASGNRLAEEALMENLIPELGSFDRILREVTVDDSRLDLVLSSGGRKHTEGRRVRWTDDTRVFVEVKSTTMAEQKDSERQALFPDAITTRGQKHLRTLMDVVKRGDRAAMVYVIQRDDCQGFAAAHEIDPDYANLLHAAIRMGVEAYALAARVTPEGVELHRRVPIRMGPHTS